MSAFVCVLVIVIILAALPGVFMEIAALLIFMAAAIGAGWWFWGLILK